MEYKFSQMETDNQQVLKFKNIKGDYKWRNTPPLSWSRMRNAINVKIHFGPSFLKYVFGFFFHNKFFCIVDFFYLRIFIFIFRI